MGNHHENQTVTGFMPVPKFIPAQLSNYPEVQKVTIMEEITFSKMKMGCFQNTGGFYIKQFCELK